MQRSLRGRVGDHTRLLVDRYPLYFDQLTWHFRLDTFVNVTTHTVHESLLRSGFPSRRVQSLFFSRENSFYHENSRQPAGRPPVRYANA